MTDHECGEATMFCTHVVNDSEEAVQEQYPDLICQECVNIMAEGNERMSEYELSQCLPKEVHVGCRNCMISKLARNM